MDDPPAWRRPPTAAKDRGRTPGLRSARIRTVVLVGLLLPLLGMGGLAAQLVASRVADRAASADLAQQAEALGHVAAVRAAIADEEIRSTIIALSRQFEIGSAELPELQQLSDPERLAAARRTVDRELVHHPDVIASRLITATEALRRSVDAGEATYPEVSDHYRRLNSAIEGKWGAQEREIEVAADRRPMSGPVRSSLRALRDTVSAFIDGGERVRYALLVFAQQGGVPAGRELVVATARFDASARQAEGSLGPRGERAWEAFETDASAQRTERLFDQAIDVGLGLTAAPAVNPVQVAERLIDGSRWAVLLTDLVVAASADLEDAARNEVREDARAVVVAAALTAALAAASIAVAVVTGRRLARPALELEAAAREIERGRFDLDPLAERGPRELAATVSAFNDMSATLAAVEDHAVALAEDPDSPMLATPLPGRTGRALQVALDRLRASIQEAELRRVELNELATRDGLTGLLNRRAAFDAIERDLARIGRDGGRLVALYVDLDGLKELNDTFGHGAGDAAIRRVAEVLAEVTRAADVVARLGGDEFLVVGPIRDGGPGVAEATALADRVHDAVRRATIRLEERDLPLRASIGVSIATPEGTVEELVRAADEALYIAKRAGRDQVAWA